MNQDTRELLSGIYKLSQTGIQAAKAVIPKTDSKQLRNELEEQLCDYSKAAADTEQRLYKNDSAPKELNPIEKAVMWGSIELHTITDTGKSHLAEIMINGTNMGIVDLTKTIGICKNAEPEVIDYARGFVKNEERHLNNLKAFLT